MEKHKCKLCFKAFMSGRALGGHMARSHFTNLPLPQKKEMTESTEPLGEITESASSELSSKGGEENDEEKGTGSYGLRENPKRSFKVIDPEFLDAGSVVVQERESESETESTLKPTRRRSKRSKRTISEHGCDQELLKKDFLLKPSSTDESLSDLSTVRSSIVSDEDVAFCLLMLSRDVWRSAADELKQSRTEEKQHRCETCNKVFKSSQALGGHRISHKKTMTPMKATSNRGNAVMKPRCAAAAATASVIKSADQKRVHECPYCRKVFGSGQALGGHKRSHFVSTPTAAATTASCSSKLGDSLEDTKPVKFQDGFIDLNLPAPMNDDDDDEGEDLTSQQEASAVSEATTDY